MHSFWSNDKKSLPSQNSLLVFARTRVIQAELRLSLSSIRKWASRFGGLQNARRKRRRQLLVRRNALRMLSKETFIYLLLSNESEPKMLFVSLWSRRLDFSHFYRSIDAHSPLSDWQPTHLPIHFFFFEHNYKEENEPASKIDESANWTKNKEVPIVCPIFKTKRFDRSSNHSTLVLNLP